MRSRALALARCSAFRAALGAPLSLATASASGAEPTKESSSNEVPARPGTDAPEIGEPPASEPEEVVVRGRRPEPSRSATLTRNEVREIPGAFGDPFRAVEALPGVTPIVSGVRQATTGTCSC